MWLICVCALLTHCGLVTPYGNKGNTSTIFSVLLPYTDLGNWGFFWHSTLLLIVLLCIILQCSSKSSPLEPRWPRPWIWQLYHLLCWIFLDTLKIYSYFPSFLNTNCWNSLQVRHWESIMGTRAEQSSHEFVFLVLEWCKIKIKQFIT